MRRDFVTAREPRTQSLAPRAGTRLAPPPRSSAFQLSGGSLPGVGDAARIRATAARGIAGASQTLPHLDRIQAAFGRHDISGVRAHLDSTALRANYAIGARAFTSGEHIAFASAPSLHLAAHEAAHVVQQRAGVRLRGGLGQSNDTYEQQADAVADRVVQGRSAESLLPHASPGRSESSVQPALQGTNLLLPEQEFRSGLVHGTYRVMDNSADMHVDQATVAHPHMTAAMIRTALQDAYQAMDANHTATGSPGFLDWRPTGAAVVKMVAELLGSALGGKWGVLTAKGQQFKRKKFGTPPLNRDANVLSSDIIPEHMSFLGSMKGNANVSIKTTLPSDNRKLAAFIRDNPNSTELERTNFGNQVAQQMEQNMLADTVAGRARMAEYQQSLTDEAPASLRIVLAHTQLPALIAALG